jgi:hypothetical protein
MPRLPALFKTLRPLNPRMHAIVSCNYHRQLQANSRPVNPGQRPPQAEHFLLVPLHVLPPGCEHGATTPVEQRVLQEEMVETAWLLPK